MSSLYKINVIGANLHQAIRADVAVKVSTLVPSMLLTGVAVVLALSVSGPGAGPVVIDPRR